MRTCARRVFAVPLTQQRNTILVECALKNLLLLAK